MMVEQGYSSEDPKIMMENAENHNKETKATITTKNPVMYLNELLTTGSSVYELESESGPPHNKNFVMSVKVNDNTVQGSGRSKKLAKAAAAQVALFKLFNVVYAPEGNNGDLNSADGKNNYEGQGGEMAAQKRSFPWNGENGDGRPVKKKTRGPSQPKNALAELNEMKLRLEFQIMGQTGPVHAPTFNVKIEMNGEVFEGIGPTKKKAKIQAAEKALYSLAQSRDASEKDQELDKKLNLGLTSDPTWIAMTGTFTNKFDVKVETE